MKLDLDLCRQILKQTEECQAGSLLVFGIDVKDEEFKPIYEHILVCADANLIKIKEPKPTLEGINTIVIERLTWAGHDFLSLSGNEEIWIRIKNIIEEKSDGISLKTVNELLENECKKLYGLN